MQIHHIPPAPWATFVLRPPILPLNTAFIFAPYLTDAPCRLCWLGVGGAPHKQDAHGPKGYPC